MDRGVPAGVGERRHPAAVALFAEDSSYRSNIFEEPYLGRAGVEAYWTTVTAVQSDVGCGWARR